MDLPGKFDGTSENIWDKLSENPYRSTAQDNQPPDFHDWDRSAAELAATQTVVAANVTELATHANYLVATNAGGVKSGVTGLSASEAGTVVHQNVLTLAGVVLTANHDNASHGNYTSQELYDLPEGNINVLGAVLSLSITRGVGGISDTAALVVGLGTQAAAQSASDGALAADEASIIPSTAFTLAGGTIAATPGVSTAIKIIDGHASAGKVYLNIQCPTADSAGTDTLIVTGTVKISWVQLGDV